MCGMETSMLDSVVERLLAARGQWPRIAAETGISVRTIEKIARREIENPGVKSIERLNGHMLDRRAPKHSEQESAA